MAGVRYVGGCVCGHRLVVHQDLEGRYAACRTCACRTFMERLYTLSEVAKMFRVDSKTVTRWANIGRITSVRTAGGSRRLIADEIDEKMKEMGNL